MRVEDCHDVLGIEPGATATDIRRAYRRLALRYHPDHNNHDPAAHQRFALIANAYRILIDLVEADLPPQRCHCELCGAAGRVYEHTDGRICCAVCLLGRRRLLLPLPIFRLVRFHGVLALWVFSVAAAARGVGADRAEWLAAAWIGAISGLVWLAAVTTLVNLVEDPATERLRRRQTARRR
ncbi:MAG: Chaperone protein DnaJ [Phycisphaerae bacterium]|nr:Chaperone protein DnaJ [Phycisphaerae bacterium]